MDVLLKSLLLYFQNLWVVLVILVVALAVQCGALGFPDHMSCADMEGADSWKCKAEKCLEDDGCRKWLSESGDVNSLSNKIEMILATESATCQAMRNKKMRRKCDMMVCINDQSCLTDYTLAIEICTETEGWVKHCINNVFEKIIDESSAL